MIVKPRLYSFSRVKKAVYRRNVPALVYTLKDLKGWSIGSSGIRRIPQGAPIEAEKSEAKVTGLSQRRVRAGLISLEDRIACPSLEISFADEYMLPPLQVVSRSFIICFISDLRSSLSQVNPPVILNRISRNDAYISRSVLVVRAF